jgi:hypothetical protein
MAKLAYFGSRISPNQLETREGYRVALNVPICRTGYQDYLGSELKGHPDYDAAWNIADDEMVPVYRPLEEVTDPQTIASFEGKSVVDEHPPEYLSPSGLVTSENEPELGCGHQQNVRIGEVLEDGNTPLISDLHIKRDALIRKVNDGTRDVSCGYIYRLRRRDDGTLEQYQIRGNHVAVVPKGRAGPQIAIGDSAPPEINKREKTVKNILDHIFGRGLKDYAKDASPEELADAVRAVGKDAEPEAKEDKKKDDEVAKDKAALDAKAALDKAAADKVAKDAEEEKKKKDDEAATDAKVEDLEEEKEDKPAKDEAVVLEEEDHGKEAIKTSLDSARDLIRAMKPLVASGKAPKSVMDSYNAAVRAFNGKPNGVSPYKALATVKIPEAAALDAAAQTPTKSPVEFYAGKSFKQGKADYEAYLAQGGK